MDLLCCETTAENETRAYHDPNLLSDDRVLQNLLRAEERNSLPSNAFPSVQTEVNEHMRKIVAEWMLEVSFYKNSALLITRITDSFERMLSD